MKKAIVFIMLAAFLLPAFSEDNTLFQDGSLMYRNKQYEQARVTFENALKADPKDERIYLFLGVTYRMLNNYPKAIEVLQNGLQVATKNRYMLYINIGDCYYAKSDFTLADKNYTAAIDENGLYPDSYLQRADARMDLKNTKDAAVDYRTYLRLKPDAAQRPQIEKLLALLDKESADQAALLDNILNSLKNASSGTHTDSAGVDKFKDTGTTGGDILD